MEIESNTPFIKELEDVLKLFCEFDSGDISHIQTCENVHITDIVRLAGREFKSDEVMADGLPYIERVRMLKRYAKLAVYRALKAVTGKVLPWGSLTGIRPTKLYSQIEELERADARDMFKNTFDVTDKKIELVERILEEQKGHKNTDDRRVDIYVGIPFCTSRCSYCSFLSAEIGRCQKLVEPYIDAVTLEIESAKRIVKDNNLKVHAVYVGGGTPTSLGANELKKILERLDFGSKEFTVEAGRADTITREKLDVIRAFGANRISVNPQTFNNRTLELIGRKHTAEDTERAYYTAREYGFAINMDLIAGLEGESYEDFLATLERAISLSPHNITVHTLAIKRGSSLKERDFKHCGNSVQSMVDTAYAMLTDCGYNPYYMYRQKYVAENLENVGYAKRGYVCDYNVDIMEENTSIIAIGANAISKKVFLGENRIERFANNKDIKTYIDKSEENNSKKEEFFCN